MGDQRGRISVQTAMLLAAAILCCLGRSPADAQNRSPAAKQTQPPAGAPTAADENENPYNATIMRLPPPQQAKQLSTFVGFDCIGTKPFLMGVTKQGPAKGYAYWSLECAGGKSYMIQLTPDGAAATIDCQTLKQDGQGRECYKAF
jgi:hypothetical protein